MDAWGTSTQMTVMTNQTSMSLQSFVLNAVLVTCNTQGE